jgi:hypothetical protein
MKPLNLDNRPCSPISSNCVIWQGPDIPCIKLCTGDTVSDVIYKLGTELCTIMDELKVSNYDLTCLGINACPPDDFKGLLQLLIDKICEANGISTTPEKSTGCPDCVVSVAPCFVQGTTTTMQLVDYVQMIANRICSILTDITTINSEIDTINTTLVDLQTQIDEIEPYTLPKFPVNCILGPGDHALDVIVNALMNDSLLGYCRLISATGTPANLNAAVLSQCITDLDQPLSALPAVNTFSAYYSGTWVNSVALGTDPSIANTIKNIWVAICDIYNYLSNNASTTVVAAGDGISVSSSTVGSTTTYTVSNDFLEVFGATCTIGSGFSSASAIIPKKDPALVNGIHNGQDIIQYTTVLSNGINKTASGGYLSNACLPPLSFGTFDNTTGIFTFTDAGNYLVNGIIYLKPTSTYSEYWSGTTTYSTPPTVDQLADNFKAIGTFVIGLCPGSSLGSTDYYAAQEQTLIPNIDRNVNLSVTKVISASVGTTVKLVVLNTTNRNYNGSSYSPKSDSISLAIVKLRNGLTLSECP